MSCYFNPVSKVAVNNLKEELIAFDTFSETQVNKLLLDILPAIEFLHIHKIIHCDIKLENIIRRQSDHKFILAEFNTTERATEKNLTQIRSAEYAGSIQRDLYGLGITCVCLLTNLDPSDLIDSIGDWVWQDYLRQEVSSKLRKIIDKLLESDPKKCYRSIAEVLQDLKIQNQTLIVQKNERKLATPKITVASLIVVSSLAIPVIIYIFGSPQIVKFSILSAQVVNLLSVIGLAINSVLACKASLENEDWKTELKGIIATGMLFMFTNTIVKLLY